MPLLVKPTLVTTPPPPPPPPPPPTVRPVVDVTWTAPDGTVLPLTGKISPRVAILADGVAGLGATARSVTRRSLGTGGTFARWSHAEERLITLPMAILANDPASFLALRRQVARAFTQTTPPAGVPRPGVLRVTRADATWREISCLYLDGLGWSDSPAFGALQDIAVLQLVAPDPWWYGRTEMVLDFADSTALRDYLSPYETVSNGRSLGSATVTIGGDIPVDPIWTITGPADSVTVRYDPTGPGWTFGTIEAGSTITVNVTDYTVTDETGANRIGDISWPTSSLFQLQPGANQLLISIGGGAAGVSRIGCTFRPRYETA